ncbi:ATP-binding cassette domain-containing protein [Achromobacter seleniivolatilans]|uniref:ATP-binding cassette domain-containing protein n=1 Tax=Achromobacter seleniivolatilans TaxID=3047478 RepID=A0ABY9M7H2_9BURK|nr:ATP-binding cassette domain-containing protein [Achromobacter sp. R39]WMD22138.1 ATP-binding cassette domain-containing protein [Achromobacter sp. R39]
MTTLSLQDIKGGYAPAEQIVKGIDLFVAPGDLAVIIGPNGAGKSTLLKLTAGLLKSREGRVVLGDEPLLAGDAQAACRAGMGFVPQERNVFAAMTVRENLELGGYLLKRGLSQRMDEQLVRFPMLKGRLKDRAGMLSGGQRQVLAVAIALMTNPAVLLLDEPTAGLSPKAATEILIMIRELAASGLAILMVEQNALLALEYGTRGIVLVAGRKARDQGAHELKQDSEMRQLFLGGKTVH